MKLDENIELNDLECTGDPVKCLGIYVGKNQVDVEKRNWEGRFGKVENILNLWKMRNLTYFGKVTVIKTLIASQFVYVASAVPVPDYISKTLNKRLYTFLWNSKEIKLREMCV